eukprot:6270661-Lingulodinium_polyedra.AAC.1
MGSGGPCGRGGRTVTTGNPGGDTAPTVAPPTGPAPLRPITPNARPNGGKRHRGPGGPRCKRRP